MGLKTPWGKEYNSFNELENDGWIQEKGGHTTKVIRQYQTVIWLVGLIIIGGYILYSYHIDYEHMRIAYDAAVLGTPGQYIQYMKRVNMTEVPLFKYEVVVEGLNQCKLRNCLLENKDNPQICDDLRKEVHEPNVSSGVFN